MDQFIDGREMQPPEPFEKTMAALDLIGEDEEIVLLLNCQPQPLFNVLRRNGYRWEESPGPDGCFQYRISKRLLPG
jgi:tRNA 2-thiouridine synthesizing protein A